MPRSKTPAPADVDGPPSQSTSRATRQPSVPHWPRTPGEDPDAPALTPWGRLITDYIWSFRPPHTPAWISQRTGIPRQTIYNWLNRGDIPNISITLHTMAVLNIPIASLLRYLAQDGIPVPPLTIEQARARTPSRPAPAPAPAPAQQSTLPIEPAEDLAAMRARTRMALAAAGTPAPLIEQIVASLGDPDTLHSSAEGMNTNQPTPATQAHEQPTHDDSRENDREPSSPNMNTNPTSTT